MVELVEFPGFQGIHFCIHLAYFCNIFEPWNRKAKAREELARQIKAEKARINKEKAEESKKKNDLLEEYVKQFIPEETEEVIDSENQTVTIKAVVSSIDF